ncbi:E3 ubiquitin-protein ligase RNF138 isoform X2 [Pongo abelii]|uniref:E3 ubiquitin-protein ligase RNF138 isoform X2 n=1 Tax=Pongo abelii TaxID=9601 RepID=UPI0023E80852|nr:E3 ubiquitin-protein ligase RNF138 isoform X2 [Pongo abelii]
MISTAPSVRRCSKRPCGPRPVSTCFRQFSEKRRNQIPRGGKGRDKIVIICRLKTRETVRVQRGLMQEQTKINNISLYQRFCRKCFLTAMRESGAHCPLCRGNVTRRERACPERALDLENIMRKFSGSCRCCAKQIKFYRMRHHYKSCKKYQDEYGVSSIIPNFQISQDSVGNRSETSTSDNTETYQENTSSSGHPTFKCPLCQESNFTRQRLLDHCNSNHLFQIVPVTCPICVSLPWGDPSQITRNFVSHLNQRHQFDYGEFVNLQLDEETQYQTAVEESFQVNI